MSSSTAFRFRLCAPALRRLQRHAEPSTLFLSASSPSLPLRSPLATSSRSSPVYFQPIRFQQRHQEHEEKTHQAAAAAAVDAVTDPTVLPQSLREIISLFQCVSDPKAKYQQLLHYGSKLPPLDPRFKTDEHRVRGCVSRVWVRAFRDPVDPAAVRFDADSDSALTKGLAALLVLGLSGAPAPAIARISPEFVHLLGLRQSLTPSRNNGFLNMLKLMQQKALDLHARGGDSVADGVSEQKENSTRSDGGDRRADPYSKPAAAYVSDGKDGDFDANGREFGGGDEEAIGADMGVGDEVPSSSTGGRASRIREKLEKELRPTELEVEDISYQHSGHAAVRGNGGGETHFNVKIVSKEFEGKSLVKRHRLVYDLLQDELQSGLHALSIISGAPSEVGVK